MEAVISQVRGSGARKKRQAVLGLADKETQDRRARDSMARAKKEVYLKCMTIGADHLGTLTYRENVQDVGRAERDLRAWIRLVRKAGAELEYVAVWEYQQRGAIHWHLAVRGFQPVKLWREAWERVVGHGEGNVDVQDWAGRGGPASVAGYLGKYVTKDQGCWERGRRRFRSSLGIEVPREVYALGSVSLARALEVGRGVVEATVGKRARIAQREGGTLYEWGFVGGYRE